MLDEREPPGLTGQRRVLDCWEKRLHGRRFIQRDDLELSAICPELAHVSVVSCEDGSLTFRLAGSGLRQAFGQEARGMTVEGIPACRGEAWDQATHRVLARLTPAAGQTRLADGGVHYWLRLPMSSDGVHADLVLCHDRYLPAEALADPDRAARQADAAMRLDTVEAYAA